MIGKLIDAAMHAPGEAVEAAAEVATRLPMVALDVAEKTMDGIGRGFEKVTKPDRRTP